MIYETLHVLHTTAPFVAHRLTATHGVLDAIVAGPPVPGGGGNGGTSNIFDQLFGVGDDFKTAVLKRGIGIILGLAVIGVVLMIAGVQMGRTILMRTVLGLFAVFFILGPFLTYLTDKFGAITG